jgi:hypothetical protein
MKKLIFLLLFRASLLQAQESVNTSGGDATGSGGSTAYSIGQVVYTTQSGTSGTEAQGVQQPYEIFSLGNNTELNISLLVYPNPTLENLIIQINNFNNDILKFEVCDVQGKLLLDSQITEQKTTINMSNFAAATYFLNVVNQKNKKVKSFKIIKK